jgi:ADP-L-glycero-D-manno-heptose 6-epimerase
MGACSDTTETDCSYLIKNNYECTKLLANWAKEAGFRFIYASSAATYGDGSKGFSDDESRIGELTPLNMYGYSKLLIDKWVLSNGLENEVCGLRFFNVFGPNEYHKGSMKSMVYRAYYQILEKGGVKLFKSNSPKYDDGEQMRDFVYVKDVVNVILWLWKNEKVNGIFNVGTGNAKSWKQLMQAVFKAMDKPENIEFIEMPENLRNSYQNYTCADMGKLRAAGYEKEFTSLDESVKDYVQNYLAKEFPHI